MLEEMADSVYKSNVNEHVLRKLLDELHATLSIYHVWGSHLGSKQLFKQHLESKRKITEIVEKMQVRFIVEYWPCPFSRFPRNAIISIATSAPAKYCLIGR